MLLYQYLQLSVAQMQRSIEQQVLACNWSTRFNETNNDKGDFIMTNYETKFSQQLVNLRKERHLSQEELAQKLYLTRQSISKWENGDSVPDMNNLVQLAEILDVSLDELVLGITPKQSMKANQLFSKLLEQDEADKDWHQNHRWREWQYKPINNGWEWLARYWWIIFALIGMISALFFHKW